MEDVLYKKVSVLNGVGKKVEVLLQKLDLFTVKDCIYFFPREYDDRRELPQLAELANGSQKTIVATIESIKEKQVKKGMHIIEAIIVDKSAKITATWFNQAYLYKVLIPGRKVVLKGKCEQNLFSRMLQLQVQHTEILHSQKDLEENVGIIVPVYRLTAGLYQSHIRQIIKEAIELTKANIKDNLPPYIKDKFSLIPLVKAIVELHYPCSVEGYKKAKQRVVFDEFFYYQIQLEKQRLNHRLYAKTDRLPATKLKINQYLSCIDYSLTNAQKTVSEEILKDLEKDIAMNRLLQGDVGSGKTDVAIITLLCAIENNKKGVIMAPTEILATQHYAKMSKLLEGLNVPCCLLTGKMKKKDKLAMLDLLEKNVAIVVIGTHALIEKYLVFDNCGVIIIDEQHRFGVMQRILLQEKANNPHCLFMTATPIPRSFMLTCFGDLDKSIIDELPPGRIPAKTSVIKEEFLPNIYHFCYQRLIEKEQIFVVYPLIEESEKMDLKSAVEGYDSLKKLFPNHHVGLIHGRMKSMEKDQIMTDFKENKCNILVSTTVIEVGIDVPNATVMIIHDAERFGLSQLHQLRGRIGRGNKMAYCFLVSKSTTESAKERLKAMEDTNDGFKIAEYDLKIRGPGDILGTKQSGIPNFRLGDIIQDETIMLAARKCAKTILEVDSNLDNKDHQSLKKVLNSSETSMIGLHLN